MSSIFSPPPASSSSTPTSSGPLVLFFLGPFVAFFGTGYFSGFGALTAELYPTRIRATLQGFTYNIGRVVSAVAPLAIGSLAQERGFGTAFLLAAGAFVGAAAMWIWIPETRGRALRAGAPRFITVFSGFAGDRFFGTP